MLNDSQKVVFKMLADNRPMYECLKEYLIDKFSIDQVSTQQTNDEIGMQVRARLEGIKTIESAFSEIASYKTSESRPEGGNPAR